MTRLSSKIRWLAFDAVGTLIDPYPSVAYLYHDVGQKFGTRKTLVEIGQAFRAAWKRRLTDLQRRTESGDETALGTSEETEHHWWQGLVAEVLPDVTDAERCFQSLWEKFAQPQAWRVYPEVGKFLAEWKSRGFQLAMASNFDSRLHGLKAALEELSPVNLVVVSSEVGWRKPDSRFYEALLNRCGCEPDELCMIGDDFAADVAAARVCGIPAVLLSREFANRPTEAIASLTELQLACVKR